MAPHPIQAKAKILSVTSNLVWVISWTPSWICSPSHASSCWPYLSLQGPEHAVPNCTCHSFYQDALPALITMSQTAFTYLLKCWLLQKFFSDHYIYSGCIFLTFPSWLYFSLYLLLSRDLYFPCLLLIVGLSPWKVNSLQPEGFICSVPCCYPGTQQETDSLNIC